MEAFLGTICAFGFNYNPYGWAFCNGQILPISQNAALFSLLGTYYGGNGTSTFGLPNLQGRSTIHQGQLQGGSQYVMGETSGIDNVTVLVSNMPAHSHSLTVTLNGNNRNTDSNTPSAQYPAASSGGLLNFNSTGTSGSMKSPTVTLGISGGNIPVPISDPSLVMNFSIALQGIFPTRN